MDTRTRSAIAGQVAKLTTIDDLRVVSGMVRERWRSVEAEGARGFRPGEKVSFTTKKGEVIHGTVLRLGKTLIGVQVKLEGGFPITWRVAPSLLQKEG